MIKTNSIHAWFLATRPKTLTGAAAPVIIALASAYHIYNAIDWLPGLLCLGFALLMQIDANFVNDYFDHVKGVDNEERLGPKRACAQGWITPRAMRWGIGIVTTLSCLVGLPLIAWGGWESILVGISCVAFCFLYTTLFSRIALGDVLVLLFFGLIPISYTFYFQSTCSSIFDIPLGIWMLALAQGLLTDCLLLVNNFRDRDTDAKVGKTTLVTIIGPKATLFLYEIFGLLPAILAHWGIYLISAGTNTLWSLLPYAIFAIHSRNAYHMRKIYQGKNLNLVLGKTAMSIFIFAILVALSLLLG